MSAEIIEIGIENGQTRLDFPVEKVLLAAIEAGLDEVTIIGRGENGFYLASSIGDTYRTYYWLDHAKNFLRENK